MQKLNQSYIRSVVKKALDEDLKPRGDITTKLIKFKNKKTKAQIIAKQSGVISGLDFCKTAFKLVGKETVFTSKAKDGSKIKKNKVIAEIKAKTKMNTESVELGESTNWKGSKTVSLSRYSAKQGFGVQLSQLKAMPGERIPVSGIHIKMPLKEIPQLIKGLQNVYKAKTNVQLGDDD